MEFLLSGLFSDSPAASDGIQRCPFLRNINEPTSFSFGSALSPSSHHRVGGAKGPIFEDGPNFDVAFRLFHGRDGVVPLSGRAAAPAEEDHREPDRVFNPLAAKAATISLSGFGGAFGFDFFAKKWDRMNKKQSRQGKNGGNSSHEASSNEWLETGQCPIAKSYRAVSHVLPLVAKALQPPPGIKLKCPPAIVAARAALARTALVKNLRPQPLPSKMLAIALLGMAVNVPLGIWREHTVKFSPQWIMAVHAAVPFIAMLRKSVLMPKSAMAFTIAASILGQTIGSRAERIRLKSVAANSASSVSVKAVIPIENGGHCGDGEARAWNPLAVEAGGVGHCGDGEARAWNPLAVEAGGIGSAAASPKASVCY